MGHYDPAAGRRHGWLVAAGSNPAYEQFLLQHQLWYRGKARNTFWYRAVILIPIPLPEKVLRTSYCTHSFYKILFYERFWVWAWV